MREWPQLRREMNNEVNILRSLARLQRSRRGTVTVAHRARGVRRSQGLGRESRRGQLLADAFDDVKYGYAYGYVGAQQYRRCDVVLIIIHRVSFI